MGTVQQGGTGGRRAVCADCIVVGAAVVVRDALGVAVAPVCDRCLCAVTAAANLRAEHDNRTQRWRLQRRRWRRRRCRRRQSGRPWELAAHRLCAATAAAAVAASSYGPGVGSEEPRRKAAAKRKQKLDGGAQSTRRSSRCDQRHVGRAGGGPPTAGGGGAAGLGQLDVLPGGRIARFGHHKGQRGRRRRVVVELAR